MGDRQPLGRRRLALQKTWMEQWQLSVGGTLDAKETQPVGCAAAERAACTGLQDADGLVSSRPIRPSLALALVVLQAATMPKTELEKRFAKAVWLIRNGPPKAGTSNDEKLQFYGYFKQATEGDCTAAQPWAGARGWHGQPPVEVAHRTGRRRSSASSRRSGPQLSLVPPPPLKPHRCAASFSCSAIRGACQVGGLE